MNTEILTLYQNSFNGAIPAELGNLANLGRLEKAFLWQAIEPCVGFLTSVFPCVLAVSLDLELNNLNGRIPRQLENIANLSRFPHQKVFSLSSSDVFFSLAAVATLRLGGNNLRDPIPAGLCVLPLQTFMVDCALTSCTCCSGCGSRALVSA